VVAVLSKDIAEGLAEGTDGVANQNDHPVCALSGGFAVFS